MGNQTFFGSENGLDLHTSPLVSHVDISWLLFFTFNFEHSLFYFGQLEIGFELG